ncbi:hypothetical protein HWQ46_03640 [Shewanella sp. D64]|uniref:hypothetical protein n=1 Tax=unclassified Shewanella TaxID=196818 RepID=UPI0022BA4EB6|nr:MULTISPECIES: hypothetical protein [unclassified Shewanella]MEC4724639.1 hypothetical protein [Shewanella sp. D64]MEC4736584.1 hypothetical protein [Shewanella sp. E94]WBJ94741.1 hypothetical protein HWQ47_23280 [Shewanella sp. MTB7]
MFSIKASTQIIQSKLTLVLLLVVFLSQLFPTCVASDIHINEQTSQEASQALMTQNSEEQTSCCHQVGDSCANARTATEQDEHDDDDFHTSCHPPIELSFLTAFMPGQDVYLFSILYQNRSYAPPIPPPHA